MALWFWLFFLNLPAKKYPTMLTRVSRIVYIVHWILLAEASGDRREEQGTFNLLLSFGLCDTAAKLGYVL